MDAPQKPKKVKDIITRDLTAVEETDTMKDVARILANKGMSGVPVVDGDNKVIGFISEKDILLSKFPQRLRNMVHFSLRDFMDLARQLDHIGETRAINFMSMNPITVTEEDPLDGIVNLILEKGLKIIPVVRDDYLVGIVERIEICRALMENKL